MSAIAFGLSAQVNGFVSRVGVADGQLLSSP